MSESMGCKKFQKCYTYSLKIAGTFYNNHIVHPLFGIYRLTPSAIKAIARIYLY